MTLSLQTTDLALLRTARPLGSHEETNKKQNSTQNGSKKTKRTTRTLVLRQS
jgi:hypothetical protein